MAFTSILFADGDERLAPSPACEPAFFTDLNLNQIVAAITTGKEEYDLKPFFHCPLHDEIAVNYRHAVMKELEDSLFKGIIETFADGMRAVRKYLAQAEKRYSIQQKQRWFLDAAALYVKTVRRLFDDVSTREFHSPGFAAFAQYMRAYVNSERFVTLAGQTEEIAADLSAIRYNVVIQGLIVEIRPYRGEADYGVEVEAAFARFNQGSSRTFSFEFSDAPDLDSVERAILRKVAELHADTFAKLDSFCTTNADFVDPRLQRFDREVQFYIAYLNYIVPLKHAGLSFCYPYVSRIGKQVCARDAFDLALASKLLSKGTIPVGNDFELNDPERIIVVSGPNQGGKTTFARMFGQLHYLGSLGCPVPGTRARLFLPEEIFTHFERVENMASLRGKLQDDLVRIHDVLAAASPQSVLVVNEIFASTTLRDATFLSKKIAERIMALDALSVWVTFIEEVGALSAKTISMVATVAPDDPDRRTFKIVRQPADGLAYAKSIAAKYRLTYEQIMDRIP